MKKITGILATKKLKPRCAHEVTDSARPGHWFCDSCGKDSKKNKELTARYRCTQGCNYDLCEACFRDDQELRKEEERRKKEEEEKRKAAAEHAEVLRQAEAAAAEAAKVKKEAAESAAAITKRLEEEAAHAKKQHEEKEGTMQLLDGEREVQIHLVTDGHDCDNPHRLIFRNGLVGVESGASSKADWFYGESKTNGLYHLRPIISEGEASPATPQYLSTQNIAGSDGYVVKVGLPGSPRDDVATSEEPRSLWKVHTYLEGCVLLEMSSKSGWYLVAKSGLDSTQAKQPWPVRSAFVELDKAGAATFPANWEGTWKLEFLEGESGSFNKDSDGFHQEGPHPEEAVRSAYQGGP